MRIRYRSGDGTARARIVLPLALVYNETCVTMLAWCRPRDDFRMFRSDRIAGVEPTGDSFRPRRIPLLRDYVARLTAERAQTG